MSYKNVDYTFNVPESVCEISYIDNYDWSEWFFFYSTSMRRLNKNFFYRYPVVKMTENHPFDPPYPPDPP